MRRLILTLLVITLLLAACAPKPARGLPSETVAEKPAAKSGSQARSLAPTSAIPQQETAEEIVSREDLSWDDWEPYTSALRPDVGTIPPLEGLTQYRLNIHLAPDLSMLSGEATIHYTNREAAALDAVHFHLYPNLWRAGMTVSNVRVAGKTVEARLEDMDSILRVPLAAPLWPDAAVDLAMNFEIPIPAGQGVGNYGEFAFRDSVLALAHFYPTVVVYDKTWHLETPAPHGDVIYADASLFDVTFTAPAELIVVATGATLDHQTSRDGTATWRLAGGPMRDFNIVASADYQVASRQVDGVTINSYYLPQDAQNGRQVLSWAAIALDTFEAAFSSYPYRELDIVETGTSAGGIEYPGLVVVAASLYRDPDRRTFFESATVHEVAHQWWYNVVGNDQINDPWLDEALAQYSTALYYRGVYGTAGEEGFYDAMEARWDRVDHAAIPIGLPVAAYEGREYSAIVYGRGPLFLAAMRDQMGEEKMAEFLRRYYAEHVWSIATPESFQALAEDVVGQDLDALFEEWVYP